MNYLEDVNTDYDDEDDLIYQMLFDDDDDLVILRFLRLRRQQDAANRRPRKRRRYYLTRPELQQNPRDSSGWQSIYQSREDRAYIHVLGIDVGTFDYLMDSGFREAWNLRPIKRTDTDQTGASRIGARSLDAAGGLGLALHFLCSTMSEVSLQIIFALVPSTVSRYIDFALDILLEVLTQVPEGRLVWPTQQVMQANSKLINDTHPNAKYLKGAFGFMDGLNLPVTASYDKDEQNANYNGWLHSHVVSNVIVFSPDGTIMTAVINAPGSWHDSNVARPIYGLLREKTPNGFFLIADSAFPRLGVGESQKIKVPLKKNAVIPGNEHEKRRKQRESREVTIARQAVEWGMRALQGCFSRLYMPMDTHNTEGRARLLQTCMRLHNLRTERVHINQIKSVYMPVWDDGQERRLTDQQLFFRALQVDRVQDFYVEHGVDFN
ncbi:DDE family endonuclease [Rhizoctonia solani AG-3 Rhs1AP]|uniref:DDE family endonuclease n=2 Tax=Rhizoctonia solani AG-3 TaxID=1086053 RepID=A0A074S643_9AGAM|nr:DDE family endonuclease [Rhizoctonia solani AG-3 Rhs1AP]KEP45542.1 DDE family endonuclease [Rhizoctonia solani 123E]